MTAPVPPPRGVRRSRTDAVLGGVCVGVARSAGLDPLLLRVAVVAVTFLTGGGAALAYLVAWVLIPRERSAAGTLPPSPDAVAAPRDDVVGGSPREKTGTAVRAAWTAAGHDLRSLAAELRRPAPDPGPTAAPAPASAAAPAGTVPTDPPPDPGTAAPDGSIPAPRSPLSTADDAATELGERLRGPEVQAGARKAAASVSDALGASVDELGRRIRRDPG